MLEPRILDDEHFRGAVFSERRRDRPDIVAHDESDKLGSELVREPASGLSHLEGGFLEFSLTLFGERQKLRHLDHLRFFVQQPDELRDGILPCAYNLAGLFSRGFAHREYFHLWRVALRLTFFDRLRFCRHDSPERGISGL